MNGHLNHTLRFHTTGNEEGLLQFYFVLPATMADDVVSTEAPSEGNTAVGSTTSAMDYLQDEV